MNSDSNRCEANIRPYRMVIELDRERVRESGYDLDEVQALIDQICAACGSIKIGSHIYAGKGRDNDCATMGRIVKHLRKKQWFWDTVKVWQLQFPHDFLDLDKEYREAVLK